MSDDLLPCPFCAGTMVSLDCMSRDDQGVCIEMSPECLECGATIIRERMTTAEAIAAWNTRQSAEQAKSEGGELRSSAEAREAWGRILAGMKRLGMESTDIETVDDFFDATVRSSTDSGLRLDPIECVKAALERHFDTENPTVLLEGERQEIAEVVVAALRKGNRDD